MIRRGSCQHVASFFVRDDASLNAKVSEITERDHQETRFS